MPNLHIDASNGLGIALEDVIGVSAAILGITGSGKTNTAAVVIEELLANGLPMTIVDIEGEYYGLKERFEILWAGQSDRCDIRVEVDQAAELAELSLTKRLPVILDMSEFDEDDMVDFLLAYFKRLWEVAGKLKRPYQVVLEEAHEWIPQSGATKAKLPLKALLTRIALRGRKRGLAAILISQRAASVTKAVLTQTQLVFLHNAIHPTDQGVYQDIIPLAAAQVLSLINTLERGDAIVLFKNKVTTVHIRQRHTFHAGITPGLEEAVLPDLKQIDLSILNGLQSATPKEIAKQEVVFRADPKDKERIDELGEVIKKQQAEIVRLCEELKIAAGSRPPSIRRQPTPEQPPKRIVDASKFDVIDQRKMFDDLLVRVDKLHRPYYRKILKFVLEREGREFTSKQVAQLTDLKPSSINAAWSALIDLGLVKRSGHGIRQVYTSTANMFLASEFPSLDTVKIREELLARLAMGQFGK